MHRVIGVLFVLFGVVCWLLITRLAVVSIAPVGAQGQDIRLAQAFVLLISLCSVCLVLLGTSLFKRRWI